ncbi:PucR family transcriptional regulator [Nocardia sp. CA-145437]|uniref:PucR family transcriptional regulator n=1 Tax=Nocardia sp. CA-145437 TaxID=3239980 RepID=UPI003D989CEF
MRLKRSVAAVVAVAASGLSSAMLGTGSADATSGCPTLYVVAIPGTWETGANRSPIANGPGMLAGVTDGLPHSTEVAYVDYPATAFPWEGDMYGSSKKQAVQNARALIGAMAQRCDTTRVALVGYSHDADAAGDVAAEIGTGTGVVDDIARHVGATSVVRTVASAGTVWAWLGGIDTGRLSSVESVIDSRSLWQVAIGSTGSGVDGFRTSHLDAVSTQRMMARQETSRAVASFGDVEGVLLLMASPDLADRFVASTLGPLDSGHPELRESLRVYLSELCNVANAADRLFTHRNTMLRRIRRVNELLPRPLEDNALNIGMALEIHHWRGGPGASAT